MTDYYLRVSSYAGYVAWAKHFRGRVIGPHLYPACGHNEGTTYNSPESRGKWTCRVCPAEQPDRLEWDVDAIWTQARYDRYQASGFELDGPSQFLSMVALINAAIARFIGDLPKDYNAKDNFWEEQARGIGEGDRLFYEEVPWDDEERSNPSLWAGEADPVPGVLLAVVNHG